MIHFLTVLKNANIYRLILVFFTKVSRMILKELLTLPVKCHIFFACTLFVWVLMEKLLIVLAQGIHW